VPSVWRRQNIPSFVVKTTDLVRLFMVYMTSPTRTMLTGAPLLRQNSRNRLVDSLQIDFIAVMQDDQIVAPREMNEFVVIVINFNPRFVFVI
jgi:FAD synthase